MDGYRFPNVFKEKITVNFTAYGAFFEISLIIWKVGLESLLGLIEAGCQVAFSPSLGSAVRGLWALCPAVPPRNTQWHYVHVLLSNLEVPKQKR